MTFPGLQTDPVICWDRGHPSLHLKIFLQCHLTRERKGGLKILPRCCWHLSACFDWCPTCLLFHLEAQFQFDFVCWQISSAQSRQQWINCDVVCLNHSRRNVCTLFARPHKIEENCKLSRQAETLEGNLSSGVWHWLTSCQTLPPCGGICWLCSRISFINASLITPSHAGFPLCVPLSSFRAS